METFLASVPTSQDLPQCPLTAMECEHFTPKALEPDHLSLFCTSHPLSPYSGNLQFQRDSVMIAKAATGVQELNLGKQKDGYQASSFGSSY